MNGVKGLVLTKFNMDDPRLVVNFTDWAKDREVYKIIYTEKELLVFYKI